MTEQMIGWLTIGAGLLTILLSILGRGLWTERKAGR